MAFEKSYLWLEFN